MNRASSISKNRDYHILDEDLTTLGSRFGHSLITIDLDGNGYDDLVVGAPLFCEAGVNSMNRRANSRLRQEAKIVFYIEKVSNGASHLRSDIERYGILFNASTF